MNSWQLKKYKDSLKEAEVEAERKAAEKWGTFSWLTNIGVAIGLRDAQRMLGGNREPRYKPKNEEEE